MKPRFLHGLTLGLALASNVQAQIDIDKLEQLAPRNIGPAGTSGRVTAIDVMPHDKNHIVIGTASGGVWHSRDRGQTWQALFTKQATASIGALDISPHNPDVIWVGTGEGNPRNSQSSGAGVYRSLDGGETWDYMGLKETRNIHRIIVHPKDPKTIYVGAQGSAWGDSKDRGFYRSRDGGKTWKKLLYIDERSGVADMVIDPLNPEKLIVAMWDFRREPWFFTSGGKGSGLYVTHDGGDNFKQLDHKNGLPKGELGRIGLAIAPGKPEVVYAVVESEKTALYRSEDGGNQFEKINDKQLKDRPFYYSDLYVDPKNENRIYYLHSTLSKSEDGGKHFESLSDYPEGALHPDHHAFWIDPEDPTYLLDGNDGGLSISIDEGKNWAFVENLPVSQFYHVSVDMEQPYNVYGGMQDNGSWVGPSQVFRINGILTDYWELASFGDGFDLVPDPKDNNFGFTLSQGGHLSRYNRSNNSTHFIQPIHPQGEYLRFNWNAGIAINPVDKQTFYIGSQYVHATKDNGLSWEIISPDLTRNNKDQQKQTESGGLTLDVTMAENHNSITSIAPSTLKDGLIWVGTDDGRLHITRDGGENWKDVSKKLRGLPKGSWIAQVQASTHDASEVFVVANNYRRNDWKPYVYFSDNYGNSFTRLVDEDQVTGHSLAIVQDPVEKDLLFLGTETGLWFSLDRGDEWQKWHENYPTVPTQDLVIHPREHDLVIGTFGRSLWILDDIRPLRELAATKKLLNKSLHIFAIPDAQQAQIGWHSGNVMKDDRNFEGENREYGALISFSLNLADYKDDEDKPIEDELEVEITISNDKGETVRTLKHKAKDGINRLAWDLTRKGVRFPGTPFDADADEPAGPEVLPGEYQVMIKAKDQSAVAKVKVAQHKDYQLAQEQRVKREKFVRDTLASIDESTQVMDKLMDASDAIKRVEQRAKKLNLDKAEMEKITELNKAIKEKLKQHRNKMLADEEIQGLYFNPKLLSVRIYDTYSRSSYTSNPWTPVTQGDEISLKLLKQDLQTWQEGVNQFLVNDFAKYQSEVKDKGISLF